MNFSLLLENTLKSEYIERINKSYDNLLSKVIKNPSFSIVLKDDMKVLILGGQYNKCETNAYNFVKGQLFRRNNNFYPVGGYMFVGNSLHPVEHWWVYDAATNEHLEVTPCVDSENIKVYMGIINKEINDKIKASDKYWDVDFFKGGHVYFQYFH